MTDSAGPLSTVRVGERLSYTASWADFVTAARVTLETKEAADRPGYLFEANVETIGLVRALYNIRNRYSSTVDRASLLPVRFVKQTTQVRGDGNRENEKETVFDQTKHVARVGDRSIQIAPSTYDIISIVYALRSQELKDKKTYKFAGLEDTTKFVAEAEVLGRETVTTASGEQKAIKVAIRGAEAGEAVTDSYNIRAWFSDDARRLPLLITATPPFGEVKLELKNVSDGGADRDAAPAVTRQ